jgi:hypothetical protein
MATMKTIRYTGRHRAQELPVRRWLQLGAASAGVGAALVGWSLVGPQVDVAAADSASQPSASGSAASPGQGAQGVEAGSSAKPSAAPARNGAAASAPSSTSSKASRTAASEADDDAPAGAGRRSPSSTATATATAQLSESLSSPRSAQSYSVASQFIVPTTHAAAAVGATTPSVSGTSAPAGTSSILDRFTASTALSTRVAARASTAATATEPNNTPLGAPVTWKFVYTKGAEYWTPERRRELEQSAVALGAYFDAPVPITVTYEVVGDAGRINLADAISPLAGSGPGFETTVVQEKFISGLDANGPAYDGTIRFFFGNDFGLGYKVGDNDYDFVSTAMHEMVHSLGFGSDIYAPGTNTRTTWAAFDRFVVDDHGNRPIGADYRFNSAFNSDLVGLTGMYFGGPSAVAAYGKLVPLWTPYPFVDGTSLSHLDGDIFTGPNIQLMNSAANKTGNDRRRLSEIEQGIMADLGYQVRFQAPAPYAPPPPH